MAIFSDGGTTFPDFFLFLLLVFIAVTSTILNSVVFLHNYRKAASIARTLYLGLSAIDLVRGVRSFAKLLFYMNHLILIELYF